MGRCVGEQYMLSPWIVLMCHRLSPYYPPGHRHHYSPQPSAGNSSNAAYLANVCVSPAVRRRAVGRHLLDNARATARTWGVEALYVHIMAVNERAQQFYEKHGFVVEKEESSNRAHYRGHCLDGIEGAGRTLLLRDTQL